MPTVASRLPEATEASSTSSSIRPGEAALVRAAVNFVDTVLVPVQPTLQELNRLRPTLELIAGCAPDEPEVHVLLTRVRAGTRSAREAREVLTGLGLSMLESEIPLPEAYGCGFGLIPPQWHRYGAVVDELLGTPGAA